MLVASVARSQCMAYSLSGCIIRLQEHAPCGSKYLEVLKPSEAVLGPGRLRCCMSRARLWPVSTHLAHDEVRLSLQFISLHHSLAAAGTIIKRIM